MDTNLENEKTEENEKENEEIRKQREKAFLKEIEERNELEWWQR